MKRYETPRLVARGDVTEQTLGMIESNTDPDKVTLQTPLGSVGFGL
ncbi:MAG TPA: lasso RiPP family leader peptide-containing protein [Gemmatimonadaceae bacterium]|nr:lasso RiPP family leader peptide-containing protein [Gemmatimonadaceae bacterium]